MNKTNSNLIQGNKPMKKILNLIAGLSALGMVSTQAATTYVGNGNSSFGGAIGNGSLEVTDNAAGTLSFTFTRGGSDFGNALVLYFDTTSGGVNSTSGLTDTADGLRRAISGFDSVQGRSALTFATGFNADFAIALNGGFAGLWSLSPSANFSYLNSANLLRNGGTTNETAASYSFSLNVADLGLTANSGQTFNFFATYISESAFRSGETLGASYSGSPASGWNPFTAAGSNSYTLVPEPSSSLLMGLGLAGLAVLRRVRKNA